MFKRLLTAGALVAAIFTAQPALAQARGETIACREVDDLEKALDYAIHYEVLSNPPNFPYATDKMNRLSCRWRVVLVLPWDELAMIGWYENDHDVIFMIVGQEIENPYLRGRRSVVYFPQEAFDGDHWELAGRCGRSVRERGSISCIQPSDCETQAGYLRHGNFLEPPAYVRLRPDCDSRY